MSSIGNGVRRDPSTQGQGQPAIAEDHGAANGQTAIPRESPKRAPTQTGEAFLDGVQAQSTPSMPSPAASPLTQRRTNLLPGQREEGEHRAGSTSVDSVLNKLADLALINDAHVDTPTLTATTTAIAATNQPSPVVLTAEQKKVLGINAAYISSLDKTIAEIKETLSNGTWAQKRVSTTSYTPALVALESNKKPTLNLKYCANPQELAAHVDKCIDNKTLHAQFIVKNGESSNHVAYFDYKLIGDAVPSVIGIDPISDLKEPSYYLLRSVREELGELNKRIECFGVGLDIQRSNHECPIFALNLAKQVYRDSKALDKIHELNANKQLGDRSYHPGFQTMSDFLDSKVPPSLMKHSQSRTRTSAYIANNQNANNREVASELVSHKVRNAHRGRTLAEYQQAHMKRTEDRSFKVIRIFEKRLIYLEELRAAL